MAGEINFVTLSAQLEANTAAFNAQLAAARGAVNELGASLVKQGDAAKAVEAQAAAYRKQAEALSAVGSSLTRYVTLPLVAVGAASVKLASDFETTFSRIAGLTDVPAAAIAGLEKQVLSLSGATTRSPQELAQALYFVESAGISAGKAVEVLGVSAKAAAAGLGSTATVADLVTSALNAYGEAHITAAHATDVLVAAVKVGKAEPDALAQSLGRVIPIAAQMGVSFDQVAAAVAVMTRSGVDADTATTALRAILTEILNPAAQSAAQLKALGIESKQLRDTLASQGLLATLQLLKAEIGNNTDALGDIIPNVRGLTGFLNIMGQDQKGVASAFDEVTNSAGLTQKAFEAFQQTDAGKLAKSTNDIKVALTSLGADVLPGVVSALKPFVAAIDTAARAFESLPKPVQSTLLGLAAMAALAGPLLTLAGNLRRIQASIVTLGSSAEGATSKLGGLKGALSAIGTGAAIGITIGLSIKGAEAASAQSKVSNIAASAGSDIQAQIAALTKEYQAAWERYSKATKIDLPFGLQVQSLSASRAKADLDAAAKQIEALRAQQAGLAADAARAGTAIGGEGDAANATSAYLHALAQANDDVTAALLAKQKAELASDEAILGVSQAQLAQERAAQTLADAQQHYTDVLNTSNASLVKNAQLELERANASQQRAVLNLATAQDKLNRAQDSGSTPRQVQAAQADVADALVGVADATNSVTTAQKALGDATSGIQHQKDLTQASLDLKAAQLGVTQAALDLRDAQQKQADATDELRQKTDAYHEALAKLPSKVTTDISLNVQDNTLKQLGDQFVAAGANAGGLIGALFTGLGTALGGATAPAPAPLPPGVQGPLLPGQTRQAGPPAPTSSAPPLINSRQTEAVGMVVNVDATGLDVTNANLLANTIADRVRLANLTSGGPS